jgi:predicted RNA binding protein YcfA (HicA-like mRNA interferase family)
VSGWPATKAKRVLAGLLRIGWRIKRQTGSHRRLSRTGWPDYTFAFHDDAEIGPAALARVASKTGLRPEDV